MKMNFDIHKAEDVAAVMNEIYSTNPAHVYVITEQW